jgi:PGF-pre-PGF domain-containing protein
MKTKNRLSNLFIFTIILTILLVANAISVNAWENPATINLGEAGNFAVLSKVAISSVPGSIITGDVGISPADGTYITGLTCPEINGTLHVAAAGGGTLACQTVDPAYLTPTILEMQAAYTDALSRAYDVTLGGDIGGLTLIPGVYFTASGLGITSDVNLDCTSTGPNGVFIFQIGGNLNLPANTNINLIGGCQAANIFWAVAGTTTIGGGVGTESTFEGTVLGGPETSEISAVTGSTINGRLLGQKGIALDSNIVTKPTLLIEDLIAPVITLLGNSTVNVTHEDTYTDAGATALDDIDGNITIDIVTVNLVNTSIVGTYIVTYDVSDAAGNPASQVNRTVNVLAQDSVLTKINLLPTTSDLFVGSSLQMNATAFDQYDYEMNVEINYTSSNTSIVVVSNTGLVLALNSGIISINASNGNISNTSTITVLAAPVITRIDLLPITATIKGGNNQQMNATAYDQYNDEINVTFTYTSSNTSIVTVSTTGLVNAIGVGIATINASNGNISNTSTITVLAAPALTRIDLLPTSVNLTVDNTQQMNATAYDQYDDEMNVTITYTSNDTTVATVSETGLVTAIGAGNATINATSESVSNVSTIMVEVPELTTITLLPTSAGISINNTLQMTATTYDQFGFVMNEEINYTSSNASFATVSATGLVTGIGVGSATITATSGLINDTSVITVATAIFTSIELLPQIANLTITNTLQLNAIAVDQFGYAMDEEINYTSSNTSFATVNFTTGLVKAISIGSATITATSGAKINTSIITVINVTAPVITSFTLSDTSVYEDDTITGTCIADDNLDGDVSILITGIDTSSTGTKTATCTATGTTGLTDLATTTYEVNRHSSGGGSSEYTPSAISEGKIYLDMPKGIYYLIFSNDKIAITQIKLKTILDANDVRITVTQLLGKPTEVTTPNLDKIYAYLKIDHINLDNSAIEYAKIQFKVDKKWINNNDVIPSQINMYRYTSNWDLLSTEMIGENSTHYLFETDSPGLSYFVIGTPFIESTITPIIVPVTDDDTNNVVDEDEGIISDTGNVITGLVTKTNNNWKWIVGILLVLLLIGIIVATMLMPPKEKKKKSFVVGHNNHLGHMSPFNDDSVHQVIELQGIGPKYNKELLAMGILTTEQLWEADASEVAEKTSVTTSTVESWQNMAELSCIKDIGPQYSELLERSGVHSIKQLKNYEVKSLLKLVTKKEDSLKNNIQGNTPGVALVSNWIEQAKAHKFMHKA